MSELADMVLSKIRTRAELVRLGASNAHGAQMHEAIDVLVNAALTADPVDVYDVTTRAVASAVK